MGRGRLRARIIIKQGHPRVKSILNKMEYYLQQLAAVEQKIKDLVKERTRLQKKDRKGTITDDEEIELAGMDVLLEKLEDSAKRYDSYIKLAMKDEPPESMTFKDADEQWITSVTGVCISPRVWSDIAIDETIQPRPGFQTAFDEICKGVHQFTEAGHHFFLNLFLLDIIHRIQIVSDGDAWGKKTWAERKNRLHNWIWKRIQYSS
jgi:hypothetical protein